MVRHDSNRCITTRFVRSRGFTLVELLIVIGIVTLLIALLLPALNKARDTANNIKCLSNLRQVGTALQQYMTSWKGKLMPVQRTGAGNTYNSHWMSVLVNQGLLTLDGSGAADGVLICPSANPVQAANFFTTPSGPTDDIGFGLFPGTQSPENFASSYAVNADLISGTAPWDSTRARSEWFPFVYWNPAAAVLPIGQNMFSVGGSTRIPLVFDGLYGHGLDVKRFTTRHGNFKSTLAKDRLCNMVFLDGHAASIAGNALPMTGDNLTNTTTLNTDANGRWDITLVVKPVQ